MQADNGAASNRATAHFRTLERSRFELNMLDMALVSARGRDGRARTRTFTGDFRRAAWSLERGGV